MFHRRRPVHTTGKEGRRAKSAESGRAPDELDGGDAPFAVRGDDGEGGLASELAAGGGEGYVAAAVAGEGAQVGARGVLDLARCIPDGNSATLTPACSVPQQCLLKKQQRTRVMTPVLRAHMAVSLPDGWSAKLSGFPWTNN